MKSDPNLRGPVIIYEVYAMKVPMDHFFNLTRMTGQRVLINTNNVTSIVELNRGCRIFFTGGDLLFEDVTDTYDEILGMMDDAAE